MKHSKRYKQLQTQIDKTKIYPLAEAITILKQAPTKFDAGVEIHVHLGIDTSKSEQIVRSTVTLPHGTGKTKRVAAFVDDDKINEAKEAGADVIGNAEKIAEIKKSGKCDFDVAVATPGMMKKLGVIAKILGQQGLMPNPKTETVGPDVKKMVTELKTGKVAFRSDDGGNVHLLVGRVSYDQEKLIENIQAFKDALLKAKPAESKGAFLCTVALATSMGPAIKVALE